MVCEAQFFVTMISSMVALSYVRSMAISVAYLVPSCGMRALGAGPDSLEVPGAGSSADAFVVLTETLPVSSDSMPLAARPASAATSLMH